VKPVPPLTDGSIRLDPITQADQEDFLALIDDAEIRQFTLVPSDADSSFITRWIQGYVDGWETGARAGFCIRGAADDSFLGFASIVHLDLAARQGEIGYALPAAARGRGAATGAVGLLTRWGFDVLGLERLELRIDPANAASMRVAERCGYRLDGVLRSLHFKEGRRADAGVWSRLSTD
jgi:RimJ/RimL family protein N-acetyltransferase